METSESMMSQSPASVQVRWQYDNMMMMMNGRRKNSADFDAEERNRGLEHESDSYGLSEAWKTPDAVEMKRRLLFRKGIREETLRHRRIHRHGGIVGGRNIARVLTDRQSFGSRVVKHNKNYKFSSKRQHQEATSSNASTRTRTGATQAGAARQVNSNAPQLSASQRHGAKNPNINTTNQVPFPGTLTNEIRTFAEYYSVVRYHSTFCKHLGGDDERGADGQRPSSSKAVSTISIAFSPDSLTMASTHGDHSVKITSCGSGNLLQTLDGHPRTPWTVKYHPKDSSILASGCLGHQVRVWNWKSAVCLHMIRLEFAIISLSFHPTGKVLAIANGTRLHFWALDGKLKLSTDTEQRNGHPEEETVNSQTNDDTNQQRSSQQRRGLLTEVEQRHMLRCVHFPPNGDKVIVGGVNPTTDANRPRRGGISGGGMSFYLRMWDFDLEAALRPGETNMGLRRRAISNPRTFVPRALLYNDGGFDISPDGKTLCACAEYWLPDGVENAMDLLYPPRRDTESDEDDDDFVQSTSPTNSASNSSVPREPQPAHQASAVGEARDERRSTSVSPPRLRQVSTYQTPVSMSSSRNNPMTPQTPPPNAIRETFSLSPPSPPGRRFAGGLGRSTSESQDQSASTQSHYPTHPAAIPPPPPSHRRPPNPFSTLTKNLEGGSSHGRYVPHVVTVSLDTTPVDQDLSNGRNEHSSARLTDPRDSNLQASRTRPRLGQLLEACPLDGTKASAVTCVKFSPSTNFCLIGYGVREPVVEHNGNHYHPVTALYRVRGGMTHVSTMLSGDDDVNIARFHPDPGYGFVYGTKQGRVRVLSPRPWNFYNC